MSSNPASERIRYFRLTDWKGVEVCVGDDVVAPGRPLFHADLEIRLVARGQVRIEYDGTARVANEGSLLRLPAGHLHTLAPAGLNGYSFLALQIETDAIDGQTCAPAKMEMAQSGFMSAGAENDLAVIGLGAHRLLSRGPAHHVDPDAVGRAIRDLIGGAMRMQPRSSSRSASRVPAIERAVSHLREHFARDVGLDELAAAAGLSKFHFLRLFAATLGVTPHRYHLLLRIARARMLLRHGTEIAEVAARTGFFDQSHLTRCFREIVGLPPGRYQSDMVARAPAHAASDPAGVRCCRTGDGFEA